MRKARTFRVRSAAVGSRPAVLLARPGCTHHSRHLDAPFQSQYPRVHSVNVCTDSPDRPLWEPSAHASARQRPLTDALDRRPARRRCCGHHRHVVRDGPIVADGCRSAEPRSERRPSTAVRSDRSRGADSDHARHRSGSMMSRPHHARTHAPSTIARACNSPPTHRALDRPRGCGHGSSLQPSTTSSGVPR